MKKLSFCAMLLLLALRAGAHQVRIGYSAPGCETNIMAYAEEGSSFTFSGKLPENCVLDSVKVVSGLPEQSASPHFALSVGIDEYDPSRHISGHGGAAYNDCLGMTNMLVGGGLWQRENVEVLTNQMCTTASIRGALARYAAMLEPGSIFFYYQHSHGTDTPQSIITYDTAILPEELASDLAAFKDGVKLVFLMEPCFSGGMIPSNAFHEAVLENYVRIKAARRGISLAAARNSLDSDLLMMTACNSTEVSYNTVMPDGKWWGIFAYSMLNNGTSAYADRDGNGWIDFDEMFAVQSNLVLRAYNDLQHPLISSHSLARSLYACSAAGGCQAGSFTEIGKEGFTFVLPRVSSDLKVDIATRSAEPKAKPDFAVKKWLVKTSFKNIENDPYPEVIQKAKFTLPDSLRQEILDLSQVPIFICGHGLGQILDSEMYKGVFYAECYGPSCDIRGSLVCKANARKHQLDFALTMKAPSQLYRLFQGENSGNSLYIRLGNRLLAAPGAWQIKEKKGKFSANFKNAR